MTARHIVREPVALRWFLPALLAVLALAGCSSGGGETTSPTVGLDAVKVTPGKDAKAAPQVTFSSLPWKAESTQTTVIKEGKGAALTDKDIVTFNFVIYNGRDGKSAASSYGSGPAKFYAGQQGVLPGLSKGLIGKKLGSQVLLGMPPADAFGEQGNPSWKINPDDSVVFVMDLISATPMLTEAKGKAVKPKKGVATVKMNKNAPATIKIPKKTKPPTKLVVQPLITGTGPKVAKGDTVRVTYTGAVWRNGKVFDSSAKSPDKHFDFPVGAGQVIKGWDEGLIGQPTGSRVVLEVPPTYGYGAQGQPPNIKGTDVMVFVVDILGAY